MAAKFLEITFILKDKFNEGEYIQSTELINMNNIARAFRSGARYYIGMTGDTFTKQVTEESFTLIIDQIDIVRQ